MPAWGGNLPAGAVPSLESIGTTLYEVCAYVIYGGGDPVSLYAILSTDIRGRLMSVAGVSRVEVSGGEKPAFYVKIRPETLAALGISVSDVAGAIKRYNVGAAAGYLDRAGKEYLIRGDARLKTIDDIKSIPIAGKGDKTVLLGSVAKVVSAHLPKHYQVVGNGFPAVALAVYKTPGASAIGVAAGVDRELSRVSRLLPPTVSIKKVYDQSEIIAESKGEIVNDIIIGAILAVIVLYFFLGAFLPTLIVAMTIPVTFLAGLSVMHFFGLGFNLITMTALVLAIGMIVDDAIVVAENICRHGGKTGDPKEAAISGTVEIAGPDASGTFTTMAAFVPMLVITGIVSVFLRPFGLTISACLAISLILSLSIVPLLFSKTSTVLKKDFPGARLVKKMQDMIREALEFFFLHKWAVLGVAIILLAAGIICAMTGGATFLPPIDEGALLIEYVMPPGTSLFESGNTGAILDRIALSDQDVASVYKRTGSPEYGNQIEGVNRGEILIKLKPKTVRKRSATTIIAALKKAFSGFPGTVFLYHQPTQEKMDESFSGLPALFGVTLFGPDEKKLVKLAGRVERIMSTDASVSNVVNNTKLSASEIDVRPDYSQLAMHGIEVSQVMDTLLAARAGLSATRIIGKTREIPVLVRLDCNNMTDPEQLAKLPILTASGNFLPLGRVAKITVGHTPSSITRLNGQREITLAAEVDGNIVGLVSRLEKKFSSISLPKGYSIDFTGQYRILIKTAKEMLFAILAAIILIYLIMAVQFSSFLQPFIILVSIPFCLAGAGPALFVTGRGIDVSVGMGIITLVGIAVNNAIVLLDYANLMAASGAAIKDALIEAACIRLRPILLTTLTTIAALLPAAIGTTVGSKIFQPFAITVIGGLISGTAATLVVIPVIDGAVLRRRAASSC